MERDTALKSSQQGSAILVVLLSTALMGYLCYRLVVHCKAYRNLVHSYVAGFQAQQLTREQLIPISSSARTCVSQSVSSSALAQQSWDVCSLGSPAMLTQPHIALPSQRVDYNSIFFRATACQHQRVHTSDTSFSTPQAAATCMVPSSLSDPLITLDNIAVNDLSLRLPLSNPGLALATVGTLQAEGTVSLQTSALIVAGGTIRIAHLHSESSQEIAVTLLSAHGDIIVGRVSGPISVLSLGRQLLSVPLTPPSSTFILPPFMLRPSIAGIIPSTDNG